jgi:hypothetical protein
MTSRRRRTAEEQKINNRKSEKEEKNLFNTYVFFEKYLNFVYLFEELVVVKNTYTTNDRDANKLDDVDESVCVG